MTRGRRCPQDEDAVINEIAESCNSLHVDESNEQLLQKAVVTDASPRIEIVTLEGALLDQKYCVQIWKLSQSVYICIGSDSSQQMSMSNLCVAMKTRYSTTPVVSHLVGSESHSMLHSMASRIAKRTTLPQVFVSCSLSEEPPTLCAFVEKKIIEYLTTP